MSITVPKDYGYVVAAVAGSVAVNFYQIFQVIKARKQYDVVYPDLYAPHGHKNKKEFDCVQRAHQNTLENLPFVLSSMMLSGMLYPQLAAGFGSVYLAGRVLYTSGYGSGGPEGRKLGGLVSHLGDIPLFLMLFYTAYQVFPSRS
eukprot:m.92756 g.92756  ORF g.92756 m.92756 type:complete len:145 (-) comp20245_c0_seq1:287-721(-)